VGYAVLKYPSVLPFRPILFLEQATALKNIPKNNVDFGETTTENN